MSVMQIIFEDMIFVFDQLRERERDELWEGCLLRNDMKKGCLNRGRRQCMNRHTSLS